MSGGIARFRPPRGPRNTVVVVVVVVLIVIINPGQTELAKREGGSQSPPWALRSTAMRSARSFSRVYHIYIYIYLSFSLPIYIYIYTYIYIYMNRN